MSTLALVLHGEGYSAKDQTWNNTSSLKKDWKKLELHYYHLADNIKEGTSCHC